jgi:hypothetical protein
MKKKAKAKVIPKGTGTGTFWSGLLAGGAIAAGALYFLPELTKSQDSAAGGKKAAKGAVAEHKEGKGDAESTRGAAKGEPEMKPVVSKTKPRPEPEAAGGVPLFRRPEVAARLAGRFGLGESYAGSMAWKKTDALGWNAFAISPGAGAGSGGNGAAENSVSCLLESQRGDRVEVLTLVANVFNVKAAAETIAKYKAVCLGFLSETACPVTKQFVDAIGVTEGQRADTADALFDLKKINIATGYRWELTVKAK